jgi:hypothetical protein
MGVNVAVNGSTPGPPPPWPKVLATTFYLWWQRRVLHSPDHENPRRLRPPMSLRITVLVLLLAVLGVGLTDVHLAGTQASESNRPAGRVSARHGTAPRHATQPRATTTETAASTQALAAAATSRQRAASWVAAQVAHSVIVACDPLMCTTLQQAGFPAANLAPIGSGTPDPLGSGVVISTMAVRSAIGSRLTSVYAPVTLASFGSGPSLVQVLAIAPDGAAAYLADVHADLVARMTAGRELLRNRNVRASTVAADQLAAGQVDARLLVTLAALAARQPVNVTAFGDAGPGAAPDVPLREMSIRSTGAGYLHSTLLFLQAQRAPLLAVTSVSHRGATTTLNVTFTAPSPTGLLPEN